MEKIDTEYKQRNRKFWLNFSNRSTVTWLLYSKMSLFSPGAVTLIFCARIECQFRLQGSLFFFNAWIAIDSIDPFHNPLAWLCQSDNCNYFCYRTYDLRRSREKVLQRSHWN